MDEATSGEMVDFDEDTDHITQMANSDGYTNVPVEEMAHYTRGIWKRLNGAAIMIHVCPLPRPRRESRNENRRAH